MVGESYATAAVTIGTSEHVPRPSVNGITLTVSPVWWRRRAPFPTTGESAWESNAVRLAVASKDIIEIELIICLVKHVKLTQITFFISGIRMSKD